jgi:spermidine synthase
MLSLALPNPREAARVLIGGLGMGFTLGAALELLPDGAEVIVGELLPEVVEWNRGPLAELAGRPLDDPRTELVVGDVADVIAGCEEWFDAILLDVDNGPTAPTRRSNSRLYTPQGLEAARRALRPGGALAVWSVRGDRSFEGSLRTAGFRASVHEVAAHGSRGARHLVFVGRRR